MSADALDDDFLFDETIAKRSFSDVEEEGDILNSEFGGELVNEDVLQGSDDNAQATTETTAEAPAKKVDLRCLSIQHPSISGISF